jgi:signal transduction histidine kinase
MMDRGTYYHSSLECAVKSGPSLTDIDLLRAQRIEMVGKLATSIAHDLSNTLSTMLMLMRTLPRDQMAAEHKDGFDSSQFCAEHAAQLITQLLSLGRNGDEQPISVNVTQLIRVTAEIVKRTFPKTINVNVKNPPDLRPIAGNTTQLYQVLLNLCLNARDAMPAGGTLSIEARNVVLGEIASRRLSNVVRGHYVLIRVTDTGTGIPGEIVANVFEPFFTTKDRDKATGLGLFTVASIVKNHYGFFDLRTGTNKGTQITVYLPVQDKLFVTL